jgi:glycosyltransferase involved in cell wall biosynthesis
VRIASVSTDYPGPGEPGRGLFVQRRLAALSHMAEVRVLHLQPWFPWLRPVPSTNGHDNDAESPPASHVRMFYLPGVFKHLDSHWVRKAVLPRLRRLEADGPVDLIDAHFGYPEGVGCARAALELGKPVFITMRGLERPILRDRRRGPQLVWALKRCTGIICVADALKELAIQQGVDPAKVRAIPNAVDRGLFRPGDQEKARRALGIDRRDRLIVCVGMLVHGKGQHLLVEALAGLRKSHPDLRLVLIGGQAHEPRYPERLRQLIESLGLTDAVLLTGSQPAKRVATWLQAADLFALPTYDEGCCNSILEALACGIPVVTTPAGDNPRLVDTPERGLLTPMDDVRGLGEALEKALSMSWDHESIAGYSADYTWEEAARQTVSFFEERLAAIGR